MPGLVLDGFAFSSDAFLPVLEMVMTLLVQIWSLSLVSVFNVGP